MHCIWVYFYFINQKQVNFHKGKRYSGPVVHWNLLEEIKGKNRKNLQHIKNFSRIPAHEQENVSMDNWKLDWSLYGLILSPLSLSVTCHPFLSFSFFCFNIQILVSTSDTRWDLSAGQWICYSGWNFIFVLEQQGSKYIGIHFI